jgi:hypothetical protein
MGLVKAPGRRLLLNAAAVAVAVVPFVFALIRAIASGRDFRYFWVALGALCGATLIVLLPGASSITMTGAVARGVGMFVLASILATIVAALLGTTLGLGIAVVAVSFAGCTALGGILRLLARG